MSSLPPDLKLLLLGGFNAQLNESPMAGFSYNKMRGLLAYLAVEQGKDHSREFLADLLWSDFDVETARHNLRRALSNLRRALESPTGRVIFLTTNHTIRFTPNVYVDVIEFAGQSSTLQDNSRVSVHRQKALIALYKGEFLSGLCLPDCPDFEDWVQMQRETLHRRALSLLESLSNHYTRMGDYAKALQFALRYTTLEPWDEEFHRRVMRLYALNDQNSAAIQQYDICCRQLKKELGVLPSEETRFLAERIRNGKLQHGSTEVSVRISALTQTAPPSFTERRGKDRRKQQRSRTLLDELRQVSVLYCELIVAAIDDPDETMTLLSIPQSRCVEIIRQFSGHIVQTHGGGILAYFGYPQAHEYAARYAVQAALEISREATDIIGIRASVHTGLIITSSDPSMPDTVGKTSKLAIKLNHYLTYSGVAISQRTQCLVSGFFECKSLGFQFFSGHAGHLEIFKVVQKNSAYTRLDATAQLTPLVGRQGEIAGLIALWEKAAHGVGHVVLVRGEAGIGKSRLLYALKERLVDTLHTLRELRCFPEFSRSPFYPLIAMLEAVMGFKHYDKPELKCRKMVAYVETYYPESRDDAVFILAQLLSLPLCEQYQPSMFSPQKQKELTIDMLLILLKALSLQQPVLLIVEDLHWIDPSTLELLTLLVEQEERGAVLAVFTARPEFVPSWKEAFTSTLALEPLTESETAKLIASLNKNISTATIRRIVERTDGIPLFAEEITKIAIQYHQAYIPTTLHDLLTMRLDNMREAKYTAQLAATIGREFDMNLLRMIFPYDLAMFTCTLSTLQDAGLILKVNETAHHFKHALIQEAAYQSQTKADRQTTHQRIAQVLQSNFPDVVAMQPELLAQHLLSGGETRLSIEYWNKAGQRATRNSANLEAIEHFNKGLRLLTILPPDNACSRLEFDLQMSLGNALTATKGYGSFKAGQAYSRALELGKQLGVHSDLYKALWGMWLTSSSRVGHLHSLELAEKILSLAEKDNDVLRLLLAHYVMGNSLFFTGNLSAARIHLEQSVSLYQPYLHEAMISQYGENICVSSCSLLSLVLWLQGWSEQSMEISLRALDLARKINYPNSLGYALCCAAILNRWIKQIEATGQLAQEAIALSREYGFPLWEALGSVSYQWTLVMQVQIDEVEKTQQLLDAIDTIMSGSKILLLEPLCEALVHQGLFDNALSRTNEALNFINTKDSRFFESEFYRLKGVCLLETSESNTKQAEACFSQAIAISRQQNAKSLELRATISMARLWRHQDKSEDARNMLEEIYNQFTEGFDSPDLQEAARLIRRELNGAKWAKDEYGCSQMNNGLH